MRHLRRSKDSLLTMTSAAALIAASVTMAAPAFADDATAQKSDFARNPKHSERCGPEIDRGAAVCEHERG